MVTNVQFLFPVFCLEIMHMLLQFTIYIHVHNYVYKHIHISCIVR